jgi:ketosteroid isomerase-like protein
MKTTSNMTKALFWGAVMLFFTFAPIIPAMAHSVSAQIKEMDVKWVAAFKQRDFATIEALYASNGLLLPSNSPPVEGPKAIVEVWKSWGELPNVEVIFGTNRIEASSSGDMAYDFGWYTFAFDTDTGRVMDKGKYIVVWKKVDGAWKVSADIFNTNLPTE